MSGDRRMPFPLPSARRQGHDAGHRNRAGRQPPGRLSSGRRVQHGKEGAALRHGIGADLQTGWCGT